MTFAEITHPGTTAEAAHVHGDFGS